MLDFKLMFSDPEKYPGLEAWGGSMSPSMARGMLTLAGYDPEALARHSKVKALAKEMAAGKWLPNGETVVLLADGTLADGKCRLAACCLAGVPFPVIVVKGVATDAMVTIGTQRKRSTTDTMTVSGETKARDKHAIANIFKTVARGSLANINSGRSLTMLEVNQIFDLHPGLTDSLETVSGLKVKRLSPQLLSVFHYAFSLANRRKANDFMSLLGNHRTPKQVIRSLRTALDKLEGGTKRTRLPAVAFLLKAWQAYCLDEEPYELEFEEDEEMPSIWGLPEIEMPEERPETEPVSPEEAAQLSASAAAAYTDGTILVCVCEFAPDQSERTLRERNGPAGGANRPLSNSKVTAYGKDIQASRWLINGQTVKFSKSNRLIDGQHRLQASVTTGLPLITLAVFNLDDHVFPTLDGGATRNIQAILRSRGIADPKLYQSILTILARYDSGAVGQSSVPVTNFDLLETLDRHKEEIDRSVSLGAWDREYSQAVMSIAVAHAAHVILSYKDRETADGYISRILNNDSLMTGSTDWKVHRELSNATRVRRSRGAMAEKAALAILFEGWNRIILGQTRSDDEIKSAVGGQIPEPISPLMAA